MYNTGVSELKYYIGIAIVIACLCIHCSFCKEVNIYNFILFLFNNTAKYAFENVCFA